MKKILFLVLAMAGSATAFAQSAKVVVTSQGEVVGRYVKTNANSYSCEADDDFTVPKAGHKIVELSAENGQGYISCKNSGSVNVRATPSTSAAIVGKLSFYEGEMPETAECKGKDNGWYKIKLYSGKVGYVRQDLVDWTPLDF